LVVNTKVTSASESTPSMRLSSSNSSGWLPGPIDRSCAMRSTSSMTSTDGCNRRTSADAAGSSMSARPDSTTTVASVSRDIRYRIVWVLPVPGGP
jgi:hypothetical protein